MSRLLLKRANDLKDELAVNEKKGEKKHATRQNKELMQTADGAVFSFARHTAARHPVCAINSESNTTYSQILLVI